MTWLRDAANDDAGVLFFPVTPLDETGTVDLTAYRTHLRARLPYAPGAVFACCGTGEFFALAPDEYETLVRAAVQEAAGQVPVVAGVGYGTERGGPYAAPSGCSWLRPIPGRPGSLIGWVWRRKVVG